MDSSQTTSLESEWKTANKHESDKKDSRSRIRKILFGSSDILRGYKTVKSSFRLANISKGVLTTAVIGYGVGAALSFAIAFYGFKAFGAAFGGATLSGRDSVLFVFAAVSAYFSYFFTRAAIVAVVIKSLRGERTSALVGIAAVGRNLPSLISFAAFEFFVVRLIEKGCARMPIVGALVFLILKLTFAIGTVFAIPVILDSGSYVGPIEASRRSSQILKQTWKDAFRREMGLQMFFVVTFMVCALPILLTLMLSLVEGSSMVIATAALVGVLGSIALTVNSIVIGVLYQYAVSGKPSELFDSEMLRSAFTASKAMKVFAN